MGWNPGRYTIGSAYLVPPIASDVKGTIAADMAGGYIIAPPGYAAPVGKYYDSKVAAAWIDLPDSTFVSAYTAAIPIKEAHPDGGGKWYQLPNLGLPTIGTGNVPGSPIQVSNPINTVEGLISKLTSAQTWTRVGEFAIGAILIAVGMNALFKVNVASAAASVAKKVAK